MSKVIFQVELHQDDADRVCRVAGAHGIDPHVFIALAAYRYALRIESGKELPPGRGAERRHWCAVCGHHYSVIAGDCNCP